MLINQILDLRVEGFLKASGLCRRHRAKAPNVGKNAGIETLGALALRGSCPLCGQPFE
jgi:hypothetical protein